MWKKNIVYKTEYNNYNGQLYVANDEGQIYVNTDVNENKNRQYIVKSRTQEYADKWDANMFLNDFKEWNENAGVNVKLSDVYLDGHLPHFIWKNSNSVAKKNNQPVKIKNELSKYINIFNGKKMLLILGQPGIGKSTLITWITAKMSNRRDNILVYQFATDLQNMNWSNVGKNQHIFDDILKELNLSYKKLKGKTLIIDGFDEISVGIGRAGILNDIFWQLKENYMLKKFSLIITCRENYIENIQNLSCDYITLQPWDEEQIRSFCTVYSNKTECKISEKTIMNILINREILGIPLILYMVLALNISIGEENSIVDVYDKIFALDGGIYDRCIVNENYASPHRISDIKKQIHQISREIAFWMFENEPDKASILYKDYKKICDMVVQNSQYEKEILEHNVLIGSYFKKIRHCEVIETEEISFVHRTIYEYFVAEMIYNSIKDAMIDLSGESQRKFVEIIPWFLKKGEVTYTIAEYLKHKILKVCYNLNSMKRLRFYEWWENAVADMMYKGMFYYTRKNILNFSNIINKEVQCFLNLVAIISSLHSISQNKYVMTGINRRVLEKYIRYYSAEFEYIIRGKKEEERKILLNFIDFSNISLIKIDLTGAQLRGTNLFQANFEQANLREVNLEGAYLKNAKLSSAILVEANLVGADLTGADLTGANLFGANLTLAHLRGAHLNQVNLRASKLIRADLRGVNFRGIDLTGADLTGADLRDADISGNILRGHMMNIEDSIWLRDDINKMGYQLRSVHFENIMIEEENERKVISKKELFPDLK